MLRDTTQDLAPLRHQTTPPGQYDIYPAFPIGSGKIACGFDRLAEQLAKHKRIVIDGYIGVLWDELHKRLNTALQTRGIHTTWFDIRTAHLSDAQIDGLVEPFLGGDDPIFGTRFAGTLSDFFDQSKLADLKAASGDQVSIVFGCGASLADWDDALLVYVDVPKNEIQFRSRAGSITNLGRSAPESAKRMYKRFYFVDWVVLNQHKAQLLPAIDFLVDAQRFDTPVFIAGCDLRDGLTAMSTNYFRVRPWFEPGPWGGTWLKQHIPRLPQDVPNYAWSFELIVPENGLLFESDSILLELSFDFLMYHDPQAILGQSTAQFGHQFPIRFDFLDTFDGGNLSLQCHPRPEFIKQQFGEKFTQDETYYILDCAPNAHVYLGFQDGISQHEFREALERSFSDGHAVDVERFVQTVPARKHDLFLIPNGTIHCSGRNNLVLEISATPYIFTFKLYDWQRLDLDGQPRPLNIARAFQNLRFEYQGDYVGKALVSKPYLHSAGDLWRCFHLPTHPDHFYNVRRYEIDASGYVEVDTRASCQVMNLVEGTAIRLETANGTSQRFNYAETFVVPAAAQHFRLVNDTDTTAKVVNAFIREDSK